jgi:hypothetical protein
VNISLENIPKNGIAGMKDKIFVLLDIAKLPSKAVVSLFLKKFLFIYSHVHTLFGSFLPPTPLPKPLPPIPPHFQAKPVLPISLILLKRRHKYNKENKAFC